MDDLITWLREQLDLDEQKATAVFRDHTWSAYLEGGGDGWAIEGAHSGEPSCTVGNEAMAAHIARWDPNRALREVEAKRQSIKLHRPYEVETADDGLNWHYTRCAGCEPIDRELEPNESYWPCPNLRLLALPYSDRPGYQKEWRP